MTKANNRRKKRKGEKWKLGLGTAGILLTIFLVVLAVFHVRTIEVTGNLYLTEQEVRDMIISDTFSSNSLYLTWKYRNSETDNTLPSLSAVDITLLSPSHVRIHICEKKRIGYIKTEQQNVYFDKEGYIIECSGEEKEGIPEITGITIGTPVLYEKVSIEDPEILEEMIDLTKILDERSIIPGQIAFDEDNNMTLIFDKVTVELGTSEYLEEKITNLAGIFAHMEGLSGTLKMDDFTPDTKRIRFKQKEEVATPADAQPQSESDSDGTYYGDGSYYGDGTYYGDGSYYGDGTYYGDGSYYGDGTYYGDGSYYGDGTYYGEGSYYGDGTYYGDGSYYGDGTYYGDGSY
ncbi:MAG: cell division protein FtsQ/DivIB [Robinsoniella sp.]|nr:cell division protein FtsQ/DivIB [Robinsoniella sp.]